MSPQPGQGIQANQANRCGFVVYLRKSCHDSCWQSRLRRRILITFVIDLIEPSGGEPNLDIILVQQLIGND